MTGNRVTMKEETDNKGKREEWLRDEELTEWRMYKWRTYKTMERSRKKRQGVGEQ